jgi:hypothetical protein
MDGDLVSPLLGGMMVMLSEVLGLVMDVRCRVTLRNEARRHNIVVDR